MLARTPLSRRSLIISYARICTRHVHKAHAQGMPCDSLCASLSITSVTHSSLSITSWTASIVNSPCCILQDPSKEHDHYAWEEEQVSYDNLQSSAFRNASAGTIYFRMQAYKLQMSSWKLKFWHMKVWPAQLAEWRCNSCRPFLPVLTCQSHHAS